MPGNVSPVSLKQIGPIASTGVAQQIKHRLGRAPRYVDVMIQDIDMATPGQYTRTLNFVDSSVVDITIIPSGMNFILNVGR